MAGGFNYRPTDPWGVVAADDKAELKFEGFDGAGCGRNSGWYDWEGVVSGDSDRHRDQPLAVIGKCWVAVWVALPDLVAIIKD